MVLGGIGKRAQQRLHALSTHCGLLVEFQPGHENKSPLIRARVWDGEVGGVDKEFVAGVVEKRNDIHVKCARTPPHIAHT